MRGIVAWCAVAVLVLGACGSSGDGGESAPGEPPRLSILGVSVGGGEATLEYAFADDGPVRVQIDWGDGSAPQGFTGESGTFTSRHVYDAVVTSVVITVITTDADGNASAATRTLDLLGASTSAPPGTTPSATASASTAAPAPTFSAATDAPTSTSTTTTTTAPPPPPRPTTTTTTTTITTTSTTTAAPRQSRASLRGSRIRVLGDCDGIGGRGDFVFDARVEITGARTGVDQKTYGSRSDTLQLGRGDSVAVEDLLAGASPFDPGDEVTALVTFGASEVDVFGNDPDLDDVDDREEVTLRVSAGQPAVEFIVVRLGSGNCQVELVVVFEISPL